MPKKNKTMQTTFTQEKNKEEGALRKKERKEKDK